MLPTLWQLQLRIRKGEHTFGPDPEAPYAASLGVNHLERYDKADRTSTKRDPELAHCRAMANYAHDNKLWQLSLDWAIAYVHLASEAGLLRPIGDQLLPLFWKENITHARMNWGELSTSPTDALDKRTVGVTLIRVLHVCRASPAPDDLTRKWLDIIAATLPDIATHARINSRQSEAEKVQGLECLADVLREQFQEVSSTASAQDIHSFCAHQHRLQRCLNHKIAAALLNPFLPPGAVKTKLPRVFANLQEVRNARSARLGDISQSCLRALETDIQDLTDFGTCATRYWLLPVFKKAHEITNHFYTASDATKPAALRVTPYEKKYPLHWPEISTTLRFFLNNSGPGPATEIEVYFLLADSVTPTEHYITFTELDVGSYAMDLPVKILTPMTQLPIEVEIKWTNYDGQRQTAVWSGALQAQRADIDWEDLSRRDPYSLEPVDEHRLFVGRQTDVERLLRAVVSPAMGSAILHGQKRVGKTSLAKELIRRAAESQDQLTCIYLEGGDYVDPTPEGTLGRLARTLARRMQKSSRLYDHVSVPEFTKSLFQKGVFCV